MKSAQLVGSGLAAALLATVLAVSTAAALSPGNGSCDNGDYCNFQNSSYGGSVADWSGDTNVNNFNQWTYFNTATVIDNKTSSTKNLDADSIFLYQDINASGTVKCNDMGENTASYGAFDNKASSLVVSSSACGAVGP